MANIRYLRKLPQRYGLTGMSTRTPIEEKISGRRSNIPSVPHNPPSSGLVALTEEREKKPRITTTPVLTNFSDLGGGAGIGGGGGGSVGNDGPDAGNPYGGTGEAVAGQIGENLGKGVIGRGVKGAAKTGIMASILGVPASVAVPGALQAAVMSGLAPFGLANNAIGQAISGNVALGAVDASPSLSGTAASQAALAALANSPQSVLGHIGSLLGFGNTASDASAAAVDAAEQGMAQSTGVSASSNDPTASLFGSEEAAPALSAVVSSSLDQGVGSSGTGATGPGGSLGPPGTPGQAGMDAGPGGSGQGGNASGSASAGAGAGGTVICTELHRQGLMPDHIYKADSDYGDKLPTSILQGYYVIGKPIARLMARSRLVTRLIKPICLSWAYQMAYKEGVVTHGNRVGAAIEFLGIPLCKLINAATRELSRILYRDQVKTFRDHA